MKYIKVKGKLYKEVDTDYEHLYKSLAKEALELTKVLSNEKSVYVEISKLDKRLLSLYVKIGGIASQISTDLPKEALKGLESALSKYTAELKMTESKIKALQSSKEFAAAERLSKLRKTMDTVIKFDAKKHDEDPLSLYSKKYAKLNPLNKNK